MRDLPHPFWAKNGETENGHFTAARNDLPGIVAHTAAGGPKRAREVATNNGLELRKRIPLARPARSCAAPPLEKRYCKKKLLDLDLGAGLFELLLDRSGFVLVDAFLDGLRSAVNQVLGFFQA